jgi:hypothetical protein
MLVGAEKQILSWIAETQCFPKPKMPKETLSRPVKNAPDSCIAMASQLQVVDKPEGGKQLHGPAVVKTKLPPCHPRQN